MSTGHLVFSRPHLGSLSAHIKLESRCKLYRDFFMRLRKERTLLRKCVKNPEIAQQYPGIQFAGVGAVGNMNDSE